MEEETRKTGIDAINAVPWGTHICQFYDTKQDLVDILVPYFKAGLENNEFCMWVTSKPLSKEEAEEAMRKAIPDFAQYLERGQIEIVPCTEWYLKDGVFNGQRVLNAWVDKINQALAKGYDGMRVTGNTAWLEKEDWANFTDYEEKVNNAIGNYHMLAICTYPLSKCGVSEIIDVMVNHQFALTKQTGDWVPIESSMHKQAEDKYHSLSENMLNGFAYCKILVDEDNRPIDFIHLEVNDAWERLIGLKKEDVIGRKVTEAIPGIKVSKTDLISIYGKVALTGEEAKFELYFEPLEKWFNISVYSPQKGYFIAVFDNITELKQTKEGHKMTLRPASRKLLTPLQKRFISSGFEGFDDQETIELLSSLVLPEQQCKRLAAEYIEHFRSLRGFLTATPQELEQTGVSQYGIFLIKLLHELPIEVLRHKIIEQPAYNSSKEIFDYLYYSMRDLKKEVFKVIYLNSQNQIIDTEDLFEGTIDGTPIHPRQIIEAAIKHNATHLIFVHNHPSGDPTPSNSDKQLTRDLVFIGNVTLIKVVEHIIIGESRYFSFADAGLIEKYEDDFLNIRIKGMLEAGRYGHSN